MQPINYMQGYKDPFENILGQVQAYQTFSQNANTLRSQKAQSELEKAISERKIRAMQDLQNVDYNNIHALREQAMRYADLEYSKGVQAHLAQFDEKQKQAEIGRVSQTLSLLKNGKNDVAIDDLLAQAQAYENAGDSQNAQGARQMAELIRQSPQSALHQAQRLFGMMVPKEQMESYAKMIEAEKPSVQYQNMGGYGQVIKTDPITGQVTTQNVGNITQSADNYADNLTNENIAHINGQYGVQKTNIEQAGQNARSQAELEYNARMEQYKWQQEQLKNAQGKYEEFGGKVYFTWVDENGIRQALPATDANGNEMVSAGSKVSDGDKKAVREMEDQIMSSQNTVNQLESVITNLENGTLNLGLLSNTWNKTRNGLLGSTKESLAYEEMNRTINSAVNQVLMLAKGTQTEGDAQRAANTILSAPRWDNKVVATALKDLQNIANRTIALKQKQIGDIYGHQKPNPLNPQSIASKYVNGM